MIRKILDFCFDKICCNYYVPYYLCQIYFSHQLHKQYYSTKNKKNEYIDSIVSNLETKKSSFYVIVNWRAWEASFYYIFLHDFFNILHKNGNKITIIWNKDYIDILNLYKLKTDFLKFLYVEERNLLEFWSESEFRTNFKLWNEWIFIDMRELNKERDIAFFVEHISNFKYFYNLRNLLKENGNHSYDSNWSYKYDKVSKEKINKIMSYSNNGKIILCNLENKSYKLARNDMISFKTYINKLTQISKKTNLKFVINSVYNNERSKWYENIIVEKLNYQEVIWLAENGNIELFISERNWLNDVFKVFYGGIPQIIYYPDYYCPCVDKKIYEKMYKENLLWHDVIDFWDIEWNNIQQDLRKNFTNSIETNISSLIW